MERDFFGLNSMEEESSKDNNSGYMRGSVMQWPFSNKVSAIPQAMSFKTIQEEKSKKIMFDPHVSSGYADVFDGNHRMFNGVVQRNFSFDRQGSNHFPMNAYSVQHVDAHPIQRPHDVRPFSVTNHISIACPGPFFKSSVSNVVTGGHNFAAPMKQQPFGGIPVATPHSVVPVVRSMVTDQRNNSKPPAGPTQMTIFYGGSVNVYDDISPEKAQAIMYLAGNGGQSSTNTTTSKAQLQPLPPKTLGGDGAHGTQSYVSPCSGLSSPLSVTSLPSPQSRSGSSGTDELMVAKPIGDLKVPSSQCEPPKAVTMVPAAVPQARKASLARFLEKRKERVMSTVPYSVKKLSEGCPGSNNINASGSTEVRSIPASKEQSWSLGPTRDDRSIGSLQTTLGMLS